MIEKKTRTISQNEEILVECCGSEGIIHWNDRLLRFQAYCKAGQDKYDMKQWLEAIDQYSEAINIIKKDALTYYNRGLAYLSNGNILEAIFDFRKAHKLSPTMKEALFYLYNLMEFIGDHEQSEEFYSQYVTSPSIRSNVLVA